MDPALDAARPGQGGRGRGGPVPSVNDLIVAACALALRGIHSSTAPSSTGASSSTTASTSASPSRPTTASSSSTCADADTHVTRRDLGRESGCSPAACARGPIRPAELAGATFTVSNLGMFGMTRDHARDQPAAGCDPRRRRGDRQARARPGRRDRRPPADDADACPATTASSTGPTPRASCATWATCSRPRCACCCDPPIDGDRRERHPLGSTRPAGRSAHGHPRRRVRPAARRPLRRHAARRLRRRGDQGRGAAARRRDARLGPPAPQRPLAVVVDPRAQQVVRDAEPARGGGPGARTRARARRPTS